MAMCPRFSFPLSAPFSSCDHNAYILLPCSVESSEIDLSEFQEEYRANGDDGDNEINGGNQGGHEPSNGASEPASGNTNEIISSRSL